MPIWILWKLSHSFRALKCFPWPSVCRFARIGSSCLSPSYTYTLTYCCNNKRHCGRSTGVSRTFGMKKRKVVQRKNCTIEKTALTREQKKRKKSIINTYKSATTQPHWKAHDRTWVEAPKKKLCIHTYLHMSVQTFCWHKYSNVRNMYSEVYRSSCWGRDDDFLLETTRESPSRRVKGRSYNNTNSNIGAGNRKEKKFCNIKMEQRINETNQRRLERKGRRR